MMGWAVLYVMTATRNTVIVDATQTIVLKLISWPNSTCFGTGLGSLRRRRLGRLCSRFFSAGGAMIVSKLLRYYSAASSCCSLRMAAFILWNAASSHHAAIASCFL